MSSLYCFIGAKEENPCCSEELIRLTECQSDIKHHLQANHLSSEMLTEGELIFLRSGIGNVHQKQLDAMLICTKHRLTLGKHWRPSRLSCHHPKHNGKKTVLKTRDTVGVKMSQNIQQLYQVHVPVGSRKKQFYCSVIYFFEGWWKNESPVVYYDDTSYNYVD